MLCFEIITYHGTRGKKRGGDDQRYAVIRNASASTVPLDDLLGDHFYDWSDGWVARVSVREVERPEARKIKRRSRGFMGYDWMITSLLRTGDITALGSASGGAP